jgi:hypothetical protein
LFNYHLLIRLPREIAHQQPPLLLSPPHAPEVVYPPSPPNITFDLTAFNGFSFEQWPPAFETANKKEYSLLIANSGMLAAINFDAIIQLPYVVEVHSIGLQEGIDGLTFSSASSWVLTPIGGGDGKIETSGCVVTSVYKLHADRILPNGRALVLFILNSSHGLSDNDTAPPIALARKSAVSDYINAHYGFERDGKIYKGHYFCPIDAQADTVIKLETPRTGPIPIWKRFDTDFLPGPCLSGKLIAPGK